VVSGTRRSRTATLLVAFFALFTLAAFYGFAHGWRMPAATVEGRGIDGVLNYLLVSTAAICLVGHFVLCWFIWRSTGSAKTGPYHRPTRRMEWLWGLVPVLIMTVLSEAGVLVVASPVWHSMYIEEPADPLMLEVVGKQFEWFAHYPGADGKYIPHHLADVSGTDNPLGLDEFAEQPLDDIVRRGQLYLPVGRPVILRLRTHDVIHSFFVPAFRLKQDLIPGFPTRLKFTPDRVGTYELACAQLCGLGHYKMRGEVHVVEPEEFERWLRAQPTFGG